MSFRRVRPRRSIRLTATPRVEAEIPAFVPEGARDQLLRIVHTQRARKLRRRGVVLERIEDGCYAWFETGVSFMQRSMARHFRKLLRARGPIPYTVKGFDLLTQAAGRAMRQRFDDADGSGEFEVTLTIPGSPPQVLKGFATDEPFTVEARMVGMMPELAAGYGADAMAARLRIERKPGETDAELRLRVKAHPGFMGEFYSSAARMLPELAAPYGVQLMSAEELHRRYGKPKLND